MPVRHIAAAIALLAAPLAAQAPAPDGKELHGRKVVVEYADGQRIDAAFKADGTYTGKSGDQEMAGTYKAETGRLCFQYGSGSECWPYAAAFKPGEPVEVTSPDGRKAKITLQR